jgi:hypothetical protein
MVNYYQVGNLTGGINVSAEENGLNFLGQVKAEARNIENFVPLATGGQQKTKGFQVFKAVASGPISRLYRYSKFSGASILLAASQNKIYQFSQADVIDLNIVINASSKPHFETAFDKCIICDGFGTVQTYDGLITSTLSSGSPNILLGSKQSLFYQNRLWVFGNGDNPSLIYYSNPNDITNGYSTQFVNCDTNDGQKITCIEKFFLPGQLEPLILVGKENSIGIITGDGSSNNPYTFSKISQRMGIASFHQMTAFAQTAVFFSSQGIYNCKADVVNINIHLDKLSEKIDPYIFSIPSTNIAKTLAFYDWKRNRISFSVAEAGFDYPNVIYHYDLRMSAWYKERWGNNLDCSAVFIDTDGTWFHGDSLGKVYIHDDTNSFSGFPIRAIYQTPFIDFARPHELKQLKEVLLSLRGNGNYALSINTAFDFGTRLGKTTTLMLKTGNFVWGGGSWTNASVTYKWSGTPIQQKRFYPSSYFRQIQFTLVQSGVNQPIDLFELNFITS